MGLSTWSGFLVLTSLRLTFSSAPADDPIANPAAVITSGCIRLTVLTPRLVRLERACSGKGCLLPSPAFDDRATFTVVNRRLPVPSFQVERTADLLTLTTSSLRISHRQLESAQGQLQCGAQGFKPGEVTLELLIKPFSKWTSANMSSAMADGRSSVAHILPEAGNLNGTMNYGPSFAGGLDCYSKPPDCAQRYRQIIGKGLLSRSGFAIVNDTNTTRFAAGSSEHRFQWFEPSSTRVANHWLSEDLYILVSGRDYVGALGDWALVSGSPNLPPLSALGIWYSRYFPYGDSTFKSEVVSKYKANGLPLSVGVLDVPWHNIDYPIADLGPDKNGSWPYPNVPGTAKPGHSCNGWDGFTFNRTLFPNPHQFFDDMHAEGLKMILSVHMQNGIDHCQEQYLMMAHAMGFSEAEIESNKTVPCIMDNSTYVDAFFRNIVEAPPVKGTADWWWLDYPGGASHVSGWDQQEPASLFWSNHMFAEHARFHGKRPVILARYGGLGAQRDGLGFSGDTFQEYSTLEFEIEMTPLASNVIFGWWSHDIGGNHNGGTTGYDTHGAPIGPYPGDEDPTNFTGSEMLLRWIQFGAMSPIFRTHCEPTCDRYVWEFPHFPQMRAAMLLRDALVPYIYTAGLDAYHTGISLLRPMYYSWPEEDAAYKHRGQYMFGPDILVAPVSKKSDADGRAEKAVWLPPSAGELPFDCWMQWNGTLAPAKAGSVLLARWSSSEIPLFVRPGAIIPLRTLASTHAVFMDPVVWAVWVGASDGAFASKLFEDAGDGLEYAHSAPELNPSASALTESVFKVASNSTRLSFEVKPSSGHYQGQGKTRSHLMQFRGCSQVPSIVYVNGLEVPKVQPDSADPGWYISVGNDDGRDLFTEPAGTLVVMTGRQDIRRTVLVEILLQQEEPAAALEKLLV